MGKDVEWWQQRPVAGDTTAPTWHSTPEPSTLAAAPTSAEGNGGPAKPRRRTWPPYVAAVAALGVFGGCMVQHAHDQQQAQQREAKTAAYKGRSGAALTIDGVQAEVVAHWSSGFVIVELRTYADRNAKFLRIDSGDKTASSHQENGWYPKSPEIKVPFEDRLDDVTVRVEVGGKTWKEGQRAQSRMVRLSPTGIAYDAESGNRLPSDI